MLTFLGCEKIHKKTYAYIRVDFTFRNNNHECLKYFTMKILLDDLIFQSFKFCFHDKFLYMRTFYYQKTREMTTPINVKEHRGENEVILGVCSLWVCIQNDLGDEFSGAQDPPVALKPSQYIPTEHLLLSLSIGEAVCLFTYLLLGRQN